MSEMTELYLIRHGETKLNEKGVYYGWTDCSLSEKGLQQAEELSDILQGVAFDVVVSSTLERAVTTAAIVSGASPEDIICDERLKELNFGEWEGLHFSEVKQKHRDKWELWGRNWESEPTPSGESFGNMYGRVKDCMEEILDRYSGKRILIVSHQGSMRIIPLILLNLPLECYWSFTAEQGSYSHYEVDEKGLCIVRRINSRR